MAELWAAFHDAWEVLAFRTRVAILVVEADAGTATRFAVTTPRAVLAKAGTITLPALVAPLAVEAVAGTTTRLTLVAPRAMLAEAGTATRLTLVAPRAVLAEAGTAAIPALGASLAMRARISIASHCRGVGRCCRGCCGCRLHGAEVAANGSEFWLGAF